MKGQRFILVLAALALLWFPAANASTLPFEEGTVVVNPQAASEDPFQVQTSIPAIVQEVEQVNEEIKKLLDDEEDEAQAPTASATRMVKHTVQSGDSLWAIAQRLLGDGSRYREIIEANKDKYPSLEKNPDLILTGWVLDVPQEGSQAPAEDNTNAAVDTDDDDAPATNVDDDNSSSTDQVSQLPQWSTKEKIAKLQSAVDSANRKLLAQGKRIAVLNTSTIRFLIDNGFMTEEEWMAMNPPAGYTYRLDRLGKIELVGSDNKPLTNEDIAKIDSGSQAKAPEEGKAADDADKKDEKTTGNKIADKVNDFLDKIDETAEKVKNAAEEAKKKLEQKKAEEAKKAEELKKAQEAKKAEDAKKAEEDKKAAAAQAAEEKRIAEEAEKAANSRYHKMLADMGMPDVSGDKDYYSACSAGSKLLSEGFFSGTTPFYKFVNSMDYPNYNIRDLQNQLKTLQQKYEKMVRENKTDKFLGIFGSTIESTGKQIDQVKAKLQNAWKEMDKALDAAKAKAQELNSSVNSEKTKITQLQKELDAMDIYDSANASKVQAKMKEIKESKEKIEDAQEKLDHYAKVKKVFS